MNYPVNETGKRIQNYVFNYSDFLGAGNFSKCYKGYNELTRQIVAIKIIQLNSLKSKKLQELLFQEIQILKKLNHPSVLKCHQIFTSNRNCYIITELCNQGNLQNYLKLKKTFDENQANPIIKDVFQGLLYLSQNNIVHRDLKSANIFLHNGRAKIADFGFAKEINHNFKDLNIGSPLYMAPQGILFNVYGPKTEVWALGILVYELFHGSSPYINCQTEQQLKRSVMIPLNWNQLRSDLSQDIKQFILMCLEVNEKKRCTIQQLMNLGYIRRLSQIDQLSKINNYQVRSPSKSVHLIQDTRQQNYKNIQPSSQDRINNNFRQQNFVLLRQPPMNYERQNGFKSVDVRSNQKSNTYDFQSPRRPDILGGPNKPQFYSPNKKPSMINSFRPPSSNKGNLQAQSPHYVNLITQSVNHQVFERPNTFQGSQKVHLPQSYLIQNNQNLLDGKSLNQIINRPLSSNQNHPIQKSKFDAIGYNSMNGFYNINNLTENNQNFINRQIPQNDLLPPPQQQLSPVRENENNQKSYIFKSEISFKQAIFFIHHCRLIFKFLFLYKQTPCFKEEQYLKIYQHLISLLKELNKFAENGGVKTQGQKASLKIKKFKEVNLEYLAKYSKQLQDNNYNVISQPITQQSLNATNITLRQVFNQLNEQISCIRRKNNFSSAQENLIIMGHLCIIIIASLRLIQSCIESNSYKKVLQFKQIQSVLNTQKDQFTIASYKNYLEKFIK